ncbi:MAG: [FeFe] hydrogenase H-cluster radical SAM maturase HydG [Candidatus Micrarchaeota archaeon]
MSGFIDEGKISRILGQSTYASDDDIEGAIEKAKKLKGLSLEQATMLLNAKKAGHKKMIYSAAKEIKQNIYGTRLVLFAPLYLSNYCINNCLYCGFRRDNKELRRKCLGFDEIKNEVGALLNEGHKRLLLVVGEHPEFSNIEYLEKSIESVYSVKHEKTEIRRVNVNCAPLSFEEFKRLKACKIGTYQLFQETYHKETYEKAHPPGPKADYDKRIGAMDLAFKAGIDDLGIGVLFGLHDYKFETLALLMHANYLDKTYGVGPHTISVPRIEPALNAPLANNPSAPVSDEDFKQMVAVIRMAVPYTGMILTTRERAQFRDEVFSVGISQISGGSKTNPGGYSKKKPDTKNEEQFVLSDKRTLAELVKDVCKMGYLPSFCTGCYRIGRTGDYFMQFAKSGKIQNFCHPNAILTFKEYLIDYADEELKKIGNKVIEKEIENIPDEKRREITVSRLKEIENGKRDLYF